MGSDKGLLMIDSITWAERSQKLLAAVCTSTVYSLRADQQRAYAAAIPDSVFAVDSDRYKGIGPLGGLLSVHEQFPESDILLLACDMIFVAPDDLQQLIQSTGGIRAYRSGEFFEPLCAYYSAAALAKISTLYREKKTSISLQKVMLLPELRVTALAPADTGRLSSQNLPQAIANHERR